MEKLAMSNSQGMGMNGGVMRSSAKELGKGQNSMYSSRISNSYSKVNLKSLTMTTTDKKTQSEKSTIFTKSTQLSEI